MENNSRLAIKYKPLTGFMFLFCVMHSINLYGMFTKPALPARFRTTKTITPTQRAMVAAAEKKAAEKEEEEDRKAEEENLERIRLKDLKLQEEAKKRGEKRYKEILQEGQRMQSLKSIKVQASDGVTTIPLSIAKRSEILKSMLSDLGEISKDPIPLPQYSLSVIRSVCNIIPQRFINPEKVEKQIEQYSLRQLVERFKFVHDLDFSSSIQDIFKSKIVDKTQFMSFDRVIDNKDAINMIDADIPEFTSLTKMAKIHYVTIRDGQSGEFFHIPKHIYAMSEYFLGALHYNKKKEIILDKDSVNSLLKIMDIINFSKKHDGSIHKTMEYMGYDSLKSIIPILNCLDFLGFSDNIQREVRRILYSFCKEVSFNDVVPQLKTLNPHVMAEVFGNSIIDKLKSLWVEKALTRDDRKTVLDIGYKIAFSPNSKMFAATSGDGQILQLWCFNNDETIKLSQELSVKNEIGRVAFSNEIWTVAFSSDNKKLAIGTGGNHILIYDIDNQGSVINKYPQVLTGEGFFRNVICDIAFSPNGRFMVALNTDHISNSLFLWSLDKNGTINEELQILLSDKNIISPIQFNDDGTLFIAYKKFGKKTFTVASFNDKCSLESEIEIENSFSAEKVIFYRQDKKCIVMSNNGSHVNSFLDAYDFNNRDKIVKYHILDHRKYLKLWKILSDDTVFAQAEIDKGSDNSQHELLLISLIDKKNSQVSTYKSITIDKTWYGSIHFRPDGKRMIISSRCDSSGMVHGYQKGAVLYTILTDEEEKKLLNDLKKLDGYQLVLIDKMLSGATDLPSLKDYQVPPPIIDLLKDGKLVP